MPPVSQDRALKAFRGHAPDFLALDAEIGDLIRSRRSEYTLLDPHQRKTRLAAERRAHIASGMRRKFDSVPNWIINRDYLDAGRYEWDVDRDLAVRFAKRLPKEHQAPALDSVSMALFADDVVERAKRDRLLVRLHGDPLLNTASMDVACLSPGGRQEWRMDMTVIAAAGTIPVRRDAPTPAEPAKRQIKAKSTISLPGGTTARRRGDSRQ